MKKSGSLRVYFESGGGLLAFFGRQRQSHAEFGMVFAWRWIKDAKRADLRRL